MKKEYTTPLAEKVEFDYSENVTASGATSYTTTDMSTQWWECHTRYVYGDSPSVCGSQNEMSTAYWVCNNG